VIEYYLEGIYINDICTKENISAPRVYTILRDNEIERKRQRGRGNKKELASKVLKEVTKGKAIMEMCKKYNISYTQFRYWKMKL